MIRHLLKLVWNRKRVNFLIMVEIFFSFIVVFAVIFMAVYSFDNYRKPLGFRYDDVWAIRVQNSQGMPEEDKVNQLATFRALLAATKEFPEVETAALTWLAPYGRGDWNSGRKSKDGSNFDIGQNLASDDLKDVLGLKVIRGRWFSREDDGVKNYKPVVINQKMADMMFGDEDPIGKNVAEPARDNKPVEELRVIGMIEDYRNRGEFAEHRGFMFFRHDLQNSMEIHPQTIIIRVRPGTTAAFEEKLLKRLQAEASEWSIEIRPLTELRDRMLQQYLVPIAAFGLIAAFLLVMVGLGLTGVLWLNVTQRTKEIGLRRAKGATRHRIYRQILGEVLLIASFGVLIGVIVVVQFPLLDFFAFADPQIFAWAVGISLLMIYGLAILAGIYPSMLATRVVPAEALHYE